MSGVQARAGGSPASAWAWRARRLLGALITGGGLALLVEQALVPWLR